jgi:cell division protein FtsB
MPSIKEIRKMRELFATVKELKVQVSVLVKAIQELSAKVTALENA